MKWSTKGLNVMRGPGYLQLVCPAPLTEAINDIKSDVEYVIQITTYSEHKKRSLNANAYCWALCQKIAEMISRDGTYISKEDVYRSAIRDSQEFQQLLIKTKAAESFRRSFEANGIGYQVVKIGDSSEHQGYEWIGVYNGSSTYSVKEMSRLIDYLVDEAHQVGAETEPPEYVEKLLDDWGRKIEKKTKSMD